MSYHQYLIERIKGLCESESQNLLLDVYVKAKDIQLRDSDIRKGQALMVALRQTNKELYDKLSDTDADPFYDNKKIPSFEQALIDYQNN